MNDPLKPTDLSSAKVKAEIAGQSAEPLLPIEKKLIIGSLTLGVILLAVLLFLTR